MDVLELARWPVGGIRTYFRYVFGHQLFRGHYLTFVAPEGSVLPVLQQYLPENGFRFVATRDIGTGLLIATARLLAGGRFSLVHSHGFTAGAIAAPLCKLFGVPHLMTAHDVFQPGQFSGLRGDIKKRVLGRLFRMVDVIHAVTEDGRENMLEYFPFLDQDRIHTILHGIDVAAFSSAAAQDFRHTIEGLGDNDFLIGFFGRFMAQKGFRDLVNAIDILSKSNDLSRVPRVLTFGEGGFVREDYELISAMGLDEYFIRLPLTNDMAGAIKGMDLVVMPSRWEACGLLAMETLVSGVPLVGTSCIGLREVLEGTPASLVPPADPVQLAEKISHEMGAGRRHEFVEYVPHALRRFSVDRHAGELVRLYEDLVNL